MVDGTGFLVGIQQVAERAGRLRADSAVTIGRKRGPSMLGKAKILGTKVGYRRGSVHAYRTCVHGDGRTPRRDPRPTAPARRRRHPPSCGAETGMVVYEPRRRKLRSVRARLDEGRAGVRAHDGHRRRHPSLPSAVPEALRGRRSGARERRPYHKPVVIRRCQQSSPGVVAPRPPPDPAGSPEHRPDAARGPWLPRRTLMGTLGAAALILAAVGVYVSAERVRALDEGAVVAARLAQVLDEQTARAFQGG
jgi:hypothetical protein